jgi:hypothetical protein
VEEDWAGTEQCFMRDIVVMGVKERYGGRAFVTGNVCTLIAWSYGVISALLCTPIILKELYQRIDVEIVSTKSVVNVLQ